MAEAAIIEDKDAYPVKCGYCLEDEGYIRNPKMLPCGHAFCEKCLSGKQEDINYIECPVIDCKKQTTGAVEDLPSAIRRKAICDACDRKGIEFMTARSYCVECNRKYCANHEHTHNEVNDHHQILSVTEYLKSSYAREVRFCDKHKEQILSLACSKCYLIRCARCLKSGEGCPEGGHHDFVHIEEVADKVKAAVEPLKAQAEKKFDEIAALVKEVTISISHWDIDTEHGVCLIESTRDEQLSALKAQYAILEEEYVTSRTLAKKKMNKYVEEQAAVKMDEFLEQLKKLRASLTEQHPVDLLKAKSDMEKNMNDLVRGDFPKLALARLKKPSKTKRSEEIPIDVELRADDDVFYGLKSTLCEMPHSLKLVKRIVAGAVKPQSVCHHKNSILYINGLHGKELSSYNKEEFSTTKRRTDNIILSIRVYNEKLYVHHYSKPHMLTTYDMNGRKINTWAHNDINGNMNAYGCKMSFLGDRIAIANISNHCITLYKLNGEVIRNVPCNTLTKESRVILCHGNGDSVIIADEKRSKVMQLNLRTEEIEWESTEVDKPRCVGRYREDLILVANSQSLSALDLKTGALKRVLPYPDAIPMGEDLHIYDMDIDGDDLVISHGSHIYSARINVSEEQVYV